jgi:hypothetical protein
MRSFILLLFVLLAGVQESKAWIIFEYYSRSVDQPRSGYSNTSKTVMVGDVPFTFGRVQVKTVLIRCSGAGYEPCPTQVSRGDLDDPFDAAQVNNLVMHLEEALAAGQGRGSKTVHYADTLSGKTYVYRMDWTQVKGFTKTTIDKSILP